MNYQCNVTIKVLINHNFKVTIPENFTFDSVKSIGKKAIPQIYSQLFIIRQFCRKPCHRKWL